MVSAVVMSDEQFRTLPSLFSGPRLSRCPSTVFGPCRVPLAPNSILQGIQAPKDALSLLIPSNLLLFPLTTNSPEIRLRG